jgi:hypothetical protein
MARHNAAFVEAPMSDSPENTVTQLALLNLIRLLAAELVAGEHRDDVDRVVRSMEQKLNETPLPRGTDVNDARVGITKAKALLRPYVRQVREQARVARLGEQATTAPRSLKHLQ